MKNKGPEIYNITLNHLRMDYPDAEHDSPS
jgi:hypothetical protein